MAFAANDWIRTESTETLDQKLSPFDLAGKASFSRLWAAQKAHLLALSEPAAAIQHALAIVSSSLENLSC